MYCYLTTYNLKHWHLFCFPKIIDWVWIRIKNIMILIWLVSTFLKIANDIPGSYFWVWTNSPRSSGCSMGSNWDMATNTSLPFSSKPSRTVEACVIDPYLNKHKVQLEALIFTFTVSTYKRLIHKLFVQRNQFYWLGWITGKKYKCVNIVRSIIYF